MSMQGIVRTCMQDKLAHDAFTAAIAMRMTSIHKIPGSKASADRSAGRAIAALRAQISSRKGLSAQLFLPIMFLAGYETYTYNFAGCRAHLKLLRDLNAQSVLDDFQMSYIHNLDVFCASITLCTPIFLANIPNNATFTRSTQSDTAGTAFRKHRRLLGAILADELIPLIIDCAYAAKLCRQCFALTSMNEWNSLTKGVVRSCSSLTSKLLNCTPDTPEQEAVITALFIWLSHLPMGTLSASASEVFRRLIPSREQVLIEHVLQWGNTDLELRLWTAAVGLVFAVDTGAAEAFEKEVGDLSSTLGLDRPATEQLLDTYMWMNSSDLARCGGNSLSMSQTE